MGETRLIGLAGRARAGKDTVGKMISETAPYDWALMSFAGPLKKICREVYDFSHEQMHGADKEKPDLRYPRPDGTFLTAREAMQLLGTQWARVCYPNTWVELGLREATQVLAGKRYEGERYGRVIFQDCRFLNEAKAIVEAGGEVWRIYRLEADCVSATHESEREMDQPGFLSLVKYNLSNNGTLEELRSVVREIRGHR